MSSAPRSLADANQRWCPFFRESGFSNDGSYTTNRSATMRDTVCIGPECMAWRSTPSQNPDQPNEEWGVCDLMPGPKTATAEDELPF
jgi:hypothetical protein